MKFVPITEAEARGDSQPMRLACLDYLAVRGTAILRNAQRSARPRKALCLPPLARVWQVTREPWGGLTIDLETAQEVVRSSGWAVPTGGNPFTGYRLSLPVDATMEQIAYAMYDVAVRVPLGQHLGIGIFRDEDKGTIDFDSVFLTDDRHVAIAVGVAAHSTGGAYDFATGDALWMPHFKESG